MTDTTRDSAVSTDCDRGPYTAAPNFAVMSLEEEAVGKGWTRITMPCGPGGPPAPAPVVGMRGETDFDSDPSYGPGT